MKSQVYITLIFQVFFASAIAQDSGNGIYLTAADFSMGKLTHVSKHTRVKPHDLFNKNVVEVKCNDSVFVYQKANVFGYANGNGVFRFVGKESLPIINPGEHILIYRKTTGSGLKNSPIVDTYYFSKDAESTVQLLTTGNLLSAFSNDTSFTRLIEIGFTGDSDLLEYDHVHQEYRINRLLQLAHNQ